MTAKSPPSAVLSRKRHKTDLESLDSPADPERQPALVTIDIFRFEDADAVHFPAGADIFKEGDPGRMMYVMLAGKARILVHGVEVEEVGPGGVLGEMALIDNTPRSATATAITDCRLVAIGEKRFDFLVQQHPRFAIQIMRVMASRLRAAGRFI